MFHHSQIHGIDYGGPKHKYIQIPMTKVINTDKVTNMAGRGIPIFNKYLCIV